MNKFAYYMSGYAFKAFSGISKAKINIHGEENIPKGKGSIIFTANHFTRIETVFLPYHIHEITKRPVWSLAAAELFQGGLKGILEAMGAISTKDPKRDFLIVKSLLNDDADCIIFPEGMMVKNKKITSDGDFKLFEDGQVQRPRTGAATIALQTEFYRERIRRMTALNIKEFNRLIDDYDIKSPKDVMQQETFIVPVNITYYPVRAKENILSRMALNIMENPSKRVIDELLTEGTMVFSGVDVDIRFGSPISIKIKEQEKNCCEHAEIKNKIYQKDYFFNSFVESDLTSRRKIIFSNRLSSYHVMKSSANEIMRNYMEAVYEMTTLNYDHIFASILKYMPYTIKGIDQYDFRCRAFLATFACQMGLHCNFHKSLYSNQIHIITNDRFHRYQDFITLAIETGVVQEKDGRIYRNNQKLDIYESDSMQYEFHTVRVENPISVIANEVEPLVKLQAYFAGIAVKSSSDIALLMSYRLEDKQYNSYIDDFNKYVGQIVVEDDLTLKQNFEIKENSEILSVQHREFIKPYLESENRISIYNNGRPRLLKSSSDEAGILLIHDYLSCPGEMLWFADYLYEKGFTVYIPRLPGHGTMPENLSLELFTQWIEAVEEGLVLLRSLCKKKIVGGLGVGAVLSLALRFRASDIDALFMISPLQKLKDYANEFITYKGLWNQMIKFAKFQTAQKEDWITYLPEIPEFRYSTHPVSGIKQVEMLLEYVESQIKNRENQIKNREKDIEKRKNRNSGKEIEKEHAFEFKSEFESNEGLPPFLMIHSISNPLINFRGSQKLFDMVSAKRKEFYLFDLKEHVILRGKEKERIAGAVAGFLEKICL